MKKKLLFIPTIYLSMIFALCVSLYFAKEAYDNYSSSENEKITYVSSGIFNRSIPVVNIEESIRHQRKSIQDDVSARVASVESERKPLKDQINKLEEEKRRINTELTKAR